MNYSCRRSLLFGLCLALPLSAVEHAAAKGSVKLKELAVKAVPAATAVRTMTPEERDDIAAMEAETQAGIPYRLDLSNRRHYRFIMNTLARVGETPSKSPEFFRRLKKGHLRGTAANKAKNGMPSKAIMAINPSVAPAPQDLNFIAQFTAQSAPGSYRATGLSSVMGGTQATLISMELYDSNNKVYATNQGRTSQYAQGTDFQVAVSGQVPSGLSNTTTKAQGMFAYVPVNSTTGLPIVIYYRSDDTVDPTSPCMSLPNYCVRDGYSNCVSGQYRTACTNTVDNRNPIKICWYRGSQQECDYWNGTSHPDNFVFPLAGSAQYPTAPVSPPIGFVNIALQNPIKGGGCNVFFKQLGALDPANWTVSGNSISWNYPATAFPNTGECINYYDGTSTYLWMTGSVALQGTATQPPGYGALNFTSDRTQIGVPGVSTIPGMYIMQGCFAEGVKITQGNGDPRDVQDFTGNQDESVLTGSGSPIPVTGTTKGTEPHKKMVRIKTANGHELLVTSTHPIITEEGKPVMAKDLKRGTLVKTKEGPSRLVSVTRERYAGKVYNLLLGSKQEGEDTGATLFANGIVAGDSRMQAYHERIEHEKLAKNPAEALKRLPKEWVRDFSNHR